MVVTKPKAVKLCVVCWKRGYSTSRSAVNSIYERPRVGGVHARLLSERHFHRILTVDVHAHLRIASAWNDGKVGGWEVGTCKATEARPHVD